MERAQYELMAELEGELWWYRALHDDLADALRARSLPLNARVLDAGCGTGGFLKRLAEAAPSWELTGIEIDRYAVAVARQKTNAGLVRGSLGALPVPDRRFDAIVSADVIYHESVDEQAALSECHRCLKPGGCLVLNLPAYEWMRSGHDVQIRTARRYHAPGLRQLLLSAGFANVRVGYRNSLLFPLMMAHRVTTGRRTEHSDVRPLPRWLDAFFFRVTRVERALRRRSLQLPFGGSVFAIGVRP